MPKLTGIRKSRRFNCPACGGEYADCQTAKDEETGETLCVHCVHSAKLDREREFRDQQRARADGAAWRAGQ